MFGVWCSVCGVLRVFRSMGCYGSGYSFTSEAGFGKNLKNILCLLYRKKFFKSKRMKERKKIQILNVIMILRSIFVADDAPGIVSKFLKPLSIIMFYITFVRFAYFMVISILHRLYRRLYHTANAIYIFFLRHWVQCERKDKKKLRADTLIACHDKNRLNNNKNHR